MKIIKIEIKNNLLYSSLFILFTLIRRIIKLILEEKVLKKVEDNSSIKVSFLMIFFMTFFEIVIGFIHLSRKEEGQKKEEKSKNSGIELIEKKIELKPKDSISKIILLMFFSAYFELIGFISRRYSTDDINNDRYDEIHARYRSIEIVFASILCYLTSKKEIKKHQICSLIVIIICFIIVITTGFIFEDNHTLVTYLIFILISSFFRAFLDTTEEYLLEKDYLNIFKLIRFEGIINTIFMLFIYIFDKPRKEFIDLYNLGIDKIILAFFLLSIYGILTAYKNLYRRNTVKYYSPMTRALAESVLDPFFILFGSGTMDNIYFIITLICSIIMVFCSCIYNEFLILYCFNLEYETHDEIMKRSSRNEISDIEAISTML